MRISAKILIVGLLVHGLIACGDDGDDSSNNDVGVDVGADAGDVDDEEECTADTAAEFAGGVDGEQVTLGRCTLVTERVALFNGGTITVEPGSTVYFERGAGFWVQRDSAVNAVGTADEPILFTGVAQEPGGWRAIYLEDTDNPDNVFEHVTVEYGGGDGARAALRATGEAIVTVRNSTIRHSLTAGFELPNGADGEVRAFEDNTVTDNALAGIVGPLTAGALDSSNTLTGNEEDWVRVEQGNVLDLDQSVTYAALDVPYLLSSGMNIYNEAAWTVEAGADIALAAGARIRVDHDGAIVFEGTEEEPITLRGAEEAAGFWNRLYIENSGSTQNLLRHTVIADAGGGGGEEAAALSVGSGEDVTTRLTLDTVTIRDSAGHGVYADEGFGGQFDVSGCETVSFENIEGDEFAGDPLCGE